MRASDVGMAAQRDLQFRIPRKPVLRRGLRLRWEDEAWVIDGARKSQALGGAFAREHLGAYIEACDGTRALGEIGEITGIGPEAAFAAASLLWTGGIIEEGDTEPLTSWTARAPGATDEGGSGPAPALVCLLSRLGDSTGVNDSWQDAARRLVAARVRIVGPGGDTACADALAGTLAPTLSAATGPGPRAGDTLVVAVETRGAREAVARAAEQCWDAGIPLLRVRAENGAVTVGPYIDPAFSPCLECATAGEEGIGPVPGPARMDLAIGLAARAVAAVIARATVTHLPGDSQRTDLITLASTHIPVVSRPGCPVCSVSGGGAEGRGAAPVAASAPVGARYEQSVAIPPAAFVDAKGHQQHYKPSNLRLQRAFRDWPVCPRSPLPAADLSGLQRPWPSGADGRTGPGRDGEEGPSARGAGTTRLATILALAAGVREPLSRDAAADGGRATTGGGDGGADGGADLGAKLRRWTAAGGNIGSVTAYVLIPEAAGDRAGEVDGTGLAPGTYVYVERDHELALIGPAAPAGDPTRIVLTGNIDKVSQKYYAFALRLAVQDCGCAFEVIRLVARALGLPIRARSRWDERAIAALIGTDPAREPVCAVVDLPDGGGGAGEATGTGGSDAL